MIRVSAPRVVILSSRVPAVIRPVTVLFQNRSDHRETIPDISTLTSLLGLTVESLGAMCPNAIADLDVRSLERRLPMTVAPKQKVQVKFNVTFNCANDPARGNTDFRYLAIVNHAALTGGFPDNHREDDACPHDALPGSRHLDPNPDGTIVDKGCGGRKADGLLGADVTTDVVIRP